MRIKIIRYKRNLFSKREMNIGNISDTFSPVGLCTAIRHYDMPLPSGRLIYHKNITYTVALILIIVLLRLTGFSRYRNTGLPDMLFTRFIRTDRRIRRVIRTFTNFRNIFRTAHRFGVRFRRNTPLLFQLWFKSVFFKT